MSCQREIAAQIVSKNANYILAVKDNQKVLKENIAYEFKTSTFIDRHEDIGKGHGRIETRICQVITDLNELDGREKWAA